MSAPSDPEARDWLEYLAWTRHADPGQYVETEQRAWDRLQVARLRRRIAPYRIRPPREQPLGGEGDDPTSRPEGGSDASTGGEGESR